MKSDLVYNLTVLYSFVGHHFESTLRRAYREFMRQTLRLKTKVRTARALAKSAFKEAFIIHAGTTPPRAPDGNGFFEKALGRSLLKCAHYATLASFREPCEPKTTAKVTLTPIAGGLSVELTVVNTWVSQPH